MSKKYKVPKTVLPDKKIVCEECGGLVVQTYEDWVCEKCGLVFEKRYVG